MNDIHTQINKLVNRISHNANILLTRPLLVEFFDGDHKAAIMLNQILYWTDRTRDPEGKFYKTHADWKRELAFSEYQVRRVIWGDPRVQYPKRNLSDIGLSVRVKMAPNGRNATYYHLDVAQFMGMFVDWLEQRFGESVDNVLQTIKDKIQQSPQASTAQPAQSTPEPQAPIIQSVPAHDDSLSIWREDNGWPLTPKPPKVEPTERVTETYQSAWQMMDHQLKLQFDRPTYSQYLQPMNLVDVQTDDDRYQVSITVPSQLQCDMILHRLSRNIRRVWSDASGQPMAQVDLIAMTEQVWRERTKQ